MYTNTRENVANKVRKTKRLFSSDSIHKRSGSHGQPIDVVNFSLYNFILKNHILHSFLSFDNHVFNSFLPCIFSVFTQY